MVIWVIFTHSSPFKFSDSENVDVHSCHLLFDCFQFALIHGPNIPDSYVKLLFTALELTSINSHIHSWVLFLLWICLFILSGVISPLISNSILACTDLGSFSFSVLCFCLFILFMGFSRQEYWSGLPFPSPVDHVFSEVSTMTCPSWVALHGMAHSFIKTRLWSMWSNWLFFCDCGFQSVCPLMEKDKRLMEAPWLERLTEGGTGSYTRVAQKFSTWWWNDFSMCSGTKTAASFITWI